MSHNNIINIKNPLNIKVNGCHSMELYREIASVFEIEDKDEAQAQEKKEMLNAYLPTGNGFDNGSKVNYDLSKPNRIVIESMFHHTAGWSKFSIIVTPDILHGFHLEIESYITIIPYYTQDFIDFVLAEFRRELYTVIKNERKI